MHDPNTRVSELMRLQTHFVGSLHELQAIYMLARSLEGAGRMPIRCAPVKCGTPDDECDRTPPGSADGSTEDASILFEAFQQFSARLAHRQGVSHRRGKAPSRTRRKVPRVSRNQTRDMCEASPT